MKYIISSAGPIGLSFYLFCRSDKIESNKRPPKLKAYCVHSFINFIGTSQVLRIFENGTLRRIFGPKRDTNGEWRRLHNEELHNLYRSPNMVRVIKFRRLR